ncbi:MAG TPA: hypothetical protein VEB86_01630 [Chryseosolibacter sp.]|nr:hypothetical protein [Chryseosolibacter sp.]
MRRHELLKEIRKRLGKPHALLFTDESGTYQDGRKLTVKEEKYIMATHAVERITWIEEEQDFVGTK